MNFCPLVLACTIFLLVAQTIAFGIWHRTECFSSLDIPSQNRHNTPIVNNSGYSDVSIHSCSLPLARSGAC